MTITTWLAFVLAAGAGACCRYLVDESVQRRARGVFPLGTFVINVSGSLLLGLIVGLSLHHGLSNNTKTVLGTGFCGAFTTFSTFAYETIRLLEIGETRAALRNVAASTIVAALAAGAGLALALG